MPFLYSKQSINTHTSLAPGKRALLNLPITFMHFLELRHFDFLRITKTTYCRRDGGVVRESALQSVDLGFITLVESYQTTLKYGIHSFPAWRSEFKGRLWRTSRQVCLLCPWARHFMGRPSLYVEDRWPRFSSEERVGGRKGIQL